MITPIEWTAAEREAAYDAIYDLDQSSIEFAVQADEVLDALAPFVAERERAAAAKALRDAAANGRAEEVAS